MHIPALNVVIYLRRHCDRHFLIFLQKSLALWLLAFALSCSSLRAGESIGRNTFGDAFRWTCSDTRASLISTLGTSDRGMRAIPTHFEERSSWLNTSKSTAPPFSASFSTGNKLNEIDEKNN